MLQVILNGDSVVVTTSSLKDLLANHCIREGAVMVNRQFIPSSFYEQTMLREGDVVDILLPMQGG